MLAVKTFLGCIKLETGGLILMGLTFIFNIGSLIVAALCLHTLRTFTCQSVEEFLKVYSDAGLKKFDESTCSTVKTALIVIFAIVVVLVSLIATIVSVCINGINNRNHVRVRPMLIVSGILTVLSFLSVFSFYVQGIISGLINGFFYSYTFVILYSLYENFKREKHTGVVIVSNQMSLEKA